MVACYGPVTVSRKRVPRAYSARLPDANHTRGFHVIAIDTSTPSFKLLGCDGRFIHQMIADANRLSLGQPRSAVL